MVFHNGPSGIRYSRINTFQISLVHFPLLKITCIGLFNLWKQFQSDYMKSFQKHWWALGHPETELAGIVIQLVWVFWRACPWGLSFPSSDHLPSPRPRSLLAEPWHSSFVAVVYLCLVSYFKDFIFSSYFRFTAKLAIKDRDFPYFPCPHVCMA